MSTDLELQGALHIVAKRVLADAAEGYPEWDCYPDIGENDWRRVRELVENMAPQPDPETYNEAYALLESRANEVTDV